MSNNKQSMKIYTEKEILSLLKIHLADEDQGDSFVALLTPIELPTDEEINEVAMVVYGFDARDIKDVLEYKAFKRGAKYVINKIQGGNK